MHRYMRWSSKNEDKDTHTISKTGGLRLARVLKMWEVGTGGFNRRKKKYMLLWQGAGSLRLKIKIH